MTYEIESVTIDGGTVVIIINRRPPQANQDPNLDPPNMTITCDLGTGHPPTNEEIAPCMEAFCESLAE